MTDKSSDKIERDLEQERAEFRDTIDEVFNRMTLEGAWDRAGMYMRKNREEFGQTLGRVITENPFPVSLVAIGMAWIMFGSSATNRRPSRGESSRRAGMANPPNSSVSSGGTTSTGSTSDSEMKGAGASSTASKATTTDRK